MNILYNNNYYLIIIFYHLNYISVHSVVLWLISVSSNTHEVSCVFPFIKPYFIITPLCDEELSAGVSVAVDGLFQLTSIILSNVYYWKNTLPGCSFE